MTMTGYILVNSDGLEWQHKYPSKQNLPLFQVFGMRNSLQLGAYAELQRLKQNFHD